MAAEERFRWALVSVGFILASAGSVVLAGRLAPSVAMAPPELLLVLAAVGSSIGLAFGLESFRHDVVGGAFGWRQVASVVAGVAVVGAILPFAVGALDGRWQAPDSDVNRAIAPLDAGGVANERTLWIADGEVLSKQGWALGDGLKFAVTDGIRPDVSALFPPPMREGEERLKRVVRSMLTGRESREGDALSPFGIRYVIILERLAPLPYGSSTFVVPARIIDRLDQQFDMARVEVAPGIAVYENLVRRPIRYTVGIGADTERNPWRTRASRPDTYSGRPVDDRLVVLENRDTRWTVDPGRRVSPSEPGTGWASAYSVTAGSVTELRYSPSLLSILMRLIQVTTVVGAIVIWRRCAVPTAPGAPPTESGSDGSDGFDRSDDVR